MSANDRYLRWPAISAGISLAAVIIGSAVCVPGICGCWSWLPLENPDKVGIPFALLTYAGALGIFVSACWFGIAAIWGALNRSR